MPDLLDFGEVLWGDQVQGEASFINGGSEPVSIETVEASCGCTVVDSAAFVAAPIAAGERRVLPFVFNAGKNPGPKSSAIKVREAGGRTSECVVKAVVKGTWMLDPDRVDFGEVMIGSVAADRVIRVTSSQDRVRNVEIVGAAPWLEQHLAARGEGVWEVLIRLRAERLTTGASMATLIVHTDNAIKPSAAIQVRVRGVAQLQASVPCISLIGNETKVVSFTDGHGKPAKIADASSGHAGIAVHVIGESSIDVCNVSGDPLPEAVSIRVTDTGGASCTLWVSSF